MTEEVIVEGKMTEEKKYVRKKCEHGKYKFQCKTCKGSSFCIHGKYKIYCKICDGKGLCIHDSVKSNCVTCLGSSICQHKKRRSRCVLCKGGSTCPHQKIKSRCVLCHGSELCIHKVRKAMCITCLGSNVCPHQKRKSRCVLCNGREICQYQKNKSNCVECHTDNICEHDKIRYQCVTCMGPRICIHKIRKNTCITCTPSSGCQNCKFVSILSSKWKPYCFRCYCILNPDAIIPRKYKLKEHHVTDALKEHFKDQITMIFDKKIEGGCSRKRPDVCIDFGSHCLMIEIDENRHVNYTCEEKRMVDLYEDIGFRKIVFLRFNPDGYKEKKKYPTPFKYTKTGLLKLDETEFNRRMAQLIEKINDHKAEPNEQLTVEYLFYGV